MSSSVARVHRRSSSAMLLLFSVENEKHGAGVASFGITFVPTFAKVDQPDHARGVTKAREFARSSVTVSAVGSYDTL